MRRGECDDLIRSIVREIAKERGTIALELISEIHGLAGNKEVDRNRSSGKLLENHATHVIADRQGSYFSSCKSCGRGCGCG
jgi:hypothetical protein